MAPVDADIRNFKPKILTLTDYAQKTMYEDIEVRLHLQWRGF